jgi:hypothetical protein
VNPITGVSRWHPRGEVTITGVTAYCASDSTGIMFDVKKNGVSVLTSTHPTIAAGQTTTTKTTLSVDVLETDYLTIDVLSGSCTEAVVRLDYQ